MNLREKFYYISKKNKNKLNTVYNSNISNEFKLNTILCIFFSFQLDYFKFLKHVFFFIIHNQLKRKYNII